MTSHNDSDDHGAHGHAAEAGGHAHGPRIGSAGASHQK
ncbi:cation transporter, partial [Actinoplanes sp. ATCC 53533]